MSTGAPKIRHPLTFDVLHHESVVLPVLEGVLDLHKGSLHEQDHDRLTARPASAKEDDLRAFKGGWRLQVCRPRATRQSHCNGEGLDYTSCCHPISTP